MTGIIHHSEEAVAPQCWASNHAEFNYTCLARNLSLPASCSFVLSRSQPVTVGVKSASSPWEGEGREAVGFLIQRVSFDINHGIVIVGQEPQIIPVLTYIILEVYYRKRKSA